MAAVMPSDDNSVNWVKDVLGGTGLYVGATNDDHDYVLISFLFSAIYASFLTEVVYLGFFFKE